jgi:hypothetical protein
MAQTPVNRDARGVIGNRNLVAFRDRAGRVARLRALTGKGTTEVVTQALEEKLRRTCHWCGQPADAEHQIIADSEYVGGVGQVTEYRCEPDCRPDTVEGGGA